MDKGERDKVLQPSASNANAANAPNSIPAPQPKAPDLTLEPALEPEPQNLVPFPSEQEPAKEPLMSLASWYDSIPFHFCILVFPL